MSTLERLVKQHLFNEGIIQKSDCFAPLSGGRTNSVWKISGARDLICKLYSESTQNPLYENSPACEYACLKQMSGRGIAPTPRAFLETRIGDILVYDYLQGTVWNNDVAAVAELLARVHNEPAPNGLRSLAIGGKELVEQTLNILGALDPIGSAEISMLQPHIPILSEIPVCLVHTDVVPGNIIQTDQGMHLIDWQCPGIGDPVEDLAMFISPAMQQIYRGHPLTVTEHSNFLSAYPDIDVRSRYQFMAPLFHWRMAAYCAWKDARGAAGYGAAKLLEIEALKQLR